MQRDLRIRISVDRQTGELQVVNSQLNEISQTAHHTNSSVETFSSSLVSIGSKLGGLYAAEKAFEAIIKTGFIFNKNMEDSVAGLTSLTVATSSNISAMGNHLSISEKYNLAQKEAIKTTKELQAINSQTPHSLTQTTEIYKTLYVTMKKAGATNEQMIDLTKKLSIASAAGGVKFQELLAGVDGISTGTVLANSNLGRFLSSLGLTNKALKGTDNVVKLVEDRLSQMKSLDTMTVAVSNLDNAWQQLTGDITKEAFTESKQSVKDLTKTLNDNKADIVEFGLDTIRTAHLVANGFETIYLTSTLGYKELAYTFKDEIGSAINYVIDELQTTNNWWANTWIGKKAGLEKMNLSNIKVDAHALNKEIIDSKAHIYALGAESDKLLHKILTNTQAQKKYNKTVKDGKQDRLVGTKQSPVVDEKAILKKHREEIKALKEKNKLNQQAYAIYTSIMSTNYEKWLQDASDKMAKLAKSGAFTDKQLLNVWNTMQKDYEMKIEIKGIDKAQSQMDKMYDTQINLMQNGLDWGNSLTGVSQKIANAGKAFTQYTLANMKSEKAEADMSSKYSKDWLKIENSKITAKEKEAQQTALYGNFKKNIDKDQAVRHSAELAAVSNLAGSMASMYERGTSGAIAFTAVQSALGIASSWTAIAEAWALGFPENIAAVAMVASNVLPIIAQLGGSGGGGGAKAPTREDVYKKKADDYKASTKPITDRLDRQIELLKSISGYGGTAISKELTQAKATYTNDSRANAIQNLGKIGNSFSGVSSYSNNAIFGTKYANKSGYHIGNDYAGLMDNPANSSLYKSREELKRVENLYGKAIIGVQQNYRGRLTGNTFVDKQDTYASLNDKYLKDSSHQIDFLMKLKKNGDLKNFGVTEQEYKDIINQAEKTAHDFSMSIINSYKEILDAGKSFKDDYDSLFNNSYKNSQLQADKAKVDKLRGSTSLGDYLKNTITDIDKIKAKLSTKNMDTLLSENPKDLAQKVKLDKEIADAYGKSTAEAINNIDAINNVAQAMATSKNNSKAFLDSFKTPKQLAQDMAKDLNVTLATSQKGLMSLYHKLANDTDGLTSADLNLLNANKDLLTSTKAVAKAIQDNTHKVSQLDEIYKLTHTKREYELYQRQNVLKAMGSEDRARQVQINSLLDSVKATTEYSTLISDSKNRVSSYEIKQADEKIKLAKEQIQLQIDADNKQIATLNKTKDTYTTMLEKTKSAMSSISDINTSIKSTVDKLLGVNSDSNVGNFNALMQTAITTSKGKDYTATKDAVDKAITASNSLFQASNFRSKTDMEVAKKTAANQFKGISTGLDTQYDVLKKIEVNTANQIAATTSSISGLQYAITGLNSKLSVPKETNQDRLNRLNQNFGDFKAQREVYKNRLGQDSILSIADWNKAGGSTKYLKDSVLGIRKDAKALIPTLGSGYTINWNGFDRTLGDLSSRFGTDFGFLGDNNTSYSGNNSSNSRGATLDSLNKDFGSFKARREALKSTLGQNHIWSIADWEKAGGDKNYLKSSILNIRKEAQSLIPSLGADYEIDWNGQKRKLSTLSGELGKVFGFSNGGYTGDIGVNNVAGVVHGQEFVVDAPTTKNLGLNGSNGVFQEMLKELKELIRTTKIQEQRIHSMQVESIKQTKTLDRIDAYNLGLVG